MAKIEIYSGTYCGFCQRAKLLLKKRALDFIEYDVTHDEDKRNEMKKRSGGARTIPQLFINDKHIGGCQELYALDKTGGLKRMLEENEL
ncbi:MAG: glutaredoxin 3 [Mariprofundales bacterium]